MHTGIFHGQCDAPVARGPVLPDRTADRIDFADFDFRVTNLSVGTVHAHDFLRAECTLVKLDRTRGVVEG